MRILFAGTPATAVPPLRRLSEDHEIAAILTRPPAPVGRKRVLTPSPVEEAARAMGIDVLTPATLKDDRVQRAIADLAPDAVAVVAYSLLIPSSLLAVPRHGWINLHYSLLPRWRGAAPVQYAIWHGDTTTGVTTFRIDAGLDTGDIIDAAATEIGPDATSGDLLERLTLLGSDVLASTMSSLAAGTAVLTPQTGEASLAPKITPAEAKLNLVEPAESLANQIRALTPAPGAWATMAGGRMKIGPARAIRGDFVPGQIAIGDEVVLGTGAGGLVLDRIAPPGKPWMRAGEWARGVRGKVVLS